MRRLSIEALVERFPDFRVAFVLAEPLDRRARPLGGAGRGDRSGGSRMPGALGRNGAFGHSRRRRLADGLQGLWHQADELPVVGRAADQARARRPAAAGDQRAGRSLQHGVADERAVPRLRRSRHRPRATSSSASRGPTTAFSTWAPRPAKTRTIRRRRGRSSTPTRATCSVAGGTGGRTRAPPRAPQPGGPC